MLALLAETSMVAAQQMHAKAKAKVVTFTTATTHTFHVGWSASAMPSDYVPGVGLTGKPICKNTQRVHDAVGQVCKYTAKDRLFFLKRQGYCVQAVAQLCMEQNEIRISRRITALEHLDEFHTRFRHYIAKRPPVDHEDQRAAKRPCHGLS
ncbi:hypothetical protein LEN26_017472 [Aphanomyces euteiches]|nr:hypothetical protein LEN26_017472 [Aphanomyces euteiches]KAH9127832.1 hypothetical protein AeMF1_001908 [Aphanomyces euteiches]KAH9185627.1 hypothetical protein AeNC1_012398 [Aphanomyces euteiches]